MSNPTAISVILLALAAAARPAIGRAPPTFERDVRPLFKAHCFECHGDFEKPKAGLDLRLRRLILAGGKEGAAIVPGKPDESLMFRKVRDGDMPKKGKKLTPAELGVVRQWIAAGAPTARAEPADPSAAVITEEERSFWAFQPVTDPPVPEVPPETVRSPIDAFVLAKLREKGLTFSPEAGRRTLIRRAYFDLIGLPPAPEEVEAFVSDPSADAYEKVIDRLLASPHYGERWGRHWLDAAGYAEGDAGESDRPRPYAWKYRDYVIRSHNADKPFDEFIREQLAGDEMVRSPLDGSMSELDRERLIATGFLLMAPDATEGDVSPAACNVAVAETMKVIGTSLLGLTIGCAQCHDHRYDPIPQTDYYRLRAIFDPAFDARPKHWRRPSQRLISLYTDAERKQARELDARAKPLDDALTAKFKAAIDRVFERELLKVPEAHRAAVRAVRDSLETERTPEQMALFAEFPNADVRHDALDLYDHELNVALQKEGEAAAAIRATKPHEDFIAALTEVPGEAPVSRVLYRGDPDQPKQPVAPGELAVLAMPRASADVPANDPSLPTTGRRLAYAKLLTDGSHPLVARVLVNRVWLHHFGRGIVATPGDFGALGSRPSHPELLDWLASDFVHHGWKLKRLHRLIMLSMAYRQSSVRRPGQDAADPDNRLLARANLRRLEAEEVRDAILAVAESFNPRMSGPSIPVAEDRDGQVVVGRPARNAGFNRGVETIGEEAFRRSIYISASRKQPLAMLEVFDLPSMTPNCDLRRASTVAPQSLMLMNDRFIVQQAQLLASEIERAARDDPPGQVRRAWALLFSEPPTADESAAATEFLRAQARQFELLPAPAAGQRAQSPRRLALASLCQALLGSNRFLYVE